MKDGSFLLTDGERRYRAAKLIHKWGHKDFKLKLCLNESTTTEIDRVKSMFTTQDNKNLTENEIAKCFKILVDNGMSQKDIAADLGKTPAYVNQMLKYFEESEDVKAVVGAGKISAHTVVKLQGKIKDPEKRKDAIIKAVKAKEQVKGITDKKGKHDSDHNNEPEKNFEDIIEPGEGIERHANFKSGRKHAIDDIQNASGPAIIEAGKNERVSVSDVLGKMSKRDRMNKLTDELNIRYKLNLKDKGRADLFDLLCEYF